MKRESKRERERGREERHGGILAPTEHPFKRQWRRVIGGLKKDLDEGDFCYLRGFYSPYTCIIEVPHGQTALTV